MSEKKKKLEPALDFSPRQLVTMLWWNNPDFQHIIIQTCRIRIKAVKLILSQNQSIRIHNPISFRLLISFLPQYDRKFQI